MHNPSSPKRELLNGARDTLPLILGALPFGIIYGAYLVGGVAAVCIAWWKKRLLYTIGFGMLIFFLWRWVVVPG